MITHWTGTSIPLKDLATRLEIHESERRLSTETVTNVLENLSSNNNKRLLYATKILYLATSTEDSSNQIRDRGGIPLLINLLSYEDEEVAVGEEIRTNSALALANLARSASGQEAIVRESGIPALVRLFQQGSKKSQVQITEASLTALKSLSANSKHKKTILQLGLEKNMLKSSMKPKPLPTKSPTFRITGKKKDKKKKDKELNGEITDDTLVSSKSTENNQKINNEEQPKKSWRHSMPGPYKPDWNKNEERPRAQRSISTEKGPTPLSRKSSHGDIKNFRFSEDIQIIDLKAENHVNHEKQVTYSIEDNGKEIKPKRNFRDKTLKKTKSAPPVSAEINSSDEEQTEGNGEGEDNIPSIGLPDLQDSKKTERTPITRSRASKNTQKKSSNKSVNPSAKMSTDKKKSSRSFKDRDNKSMRAKSLKESGARNLDRKKTKDLSSLISDKHRSPSDISIERKKLSKQRSKSKKPQIIQIKCIWESDKRYIRVSCDIGVEGLHEAVQNEYKQTVSSIKFMDSDNDFITITKNSDIEMCFEQVGPILLFIDKNTSGKVEASQPLLSSHKSDGWSTLEWENYPWRIPHQDLDLRNAPCLGRGYFGEVRLGKWRGGYVACKVIYRTSFRDKTDEEMFIREVNVLSKLRHPQVILFMGACLDTDDKIIVTEYMSKGSLYDILHNGTELTPTQLLNVAKDITLGMSYLHGENILHRDLNCKNILINGSMSAKVADFGLSRIKAQDTTISATMGAVAWMAPEVIADASQYTTKADVYSHGIIMWEMWTRKNPVPQGMTPLQMAKMIERNNYRPEIPTTVPTEWANLIQKCWDKDQEVRPSFEEVLDIITEIEATTDIVDRKTITLTTSSSPELNFHVKNPILKPLSLSATATIVSERDSDSVESEKSVSEIETKQDESVDDYVEDESL